ncbi:hypothetical protein [uncultured Pseudoteredinibacter sp.]|uniref:hypothetical protein n=1 Tax=uncultured Pseudoteredinibacter sp. TaxID=1641701 RepID=UPI00261B474C|nr:hypothetical protein [uncultured Pseudoteredinibacter sp.]
MRKLFLTPLLILAFFSFEAHSEIILTTEINEKPVTPLITKKEGKYTIDFKNNMVVTVYTNVVDGKQMYYFKATGMPMMDVENKPGGPGTYIFDTKEMDMYKITAQVK